MSLSSWSPDHKDVRMRISRTDRTSTTRTNICAVLLAVALVGTASCSSSASNTPTAPQAADAPSAPAVNLANPYHSKDGYSISPPADWIYHPTDGQGGVSSVFGAPARDPGAKAPFVDNINVVVVPASGDLNTLVAETKQQYPSVLTNYTVTTDEPTTVNNHPAYLLGGTYEDPKSGPLQNIQIMVVDSGKLYTATFTSATPTFNSMQEVAKASLRSFRIG